MHEKGEGGRDRESVCGEGWMKGDSERCDRERVRYGERNGKREK